MSKKKDEISREDISRVMSILGAAKTEKKTAAARVNSLKGAEASRKNVLDLPCTCKGGESLKASDHVTTCPRGRLLWQRERASKAKASSQVANGSQ